MLFRSATLPAGSHLSALQGLSTNLTEQATVLSRVLQPAPDTTERSLVNDQPRSLGEAWRRVRAQLRVQSALFRHAVRLAVALLLGFALMHLTDDRHGYWIVLTITFVSQPHYAATLKRLSQRVGGTMMGLALGWALMRLFPDDLAGSVLIAISGAVFLGTRRTHYAVATGAITTLLLMAFHQLGMSEGVILGRLVDTLAGGAIAGVAAWLVLPNWQARQWHTLAAATLRAQARYLDEVLRQYQSGKQDHLAYRIARRNMHKADAALSNSLAAMLKEPASVRLDTAVCGRYLVATHTLLNYLSALGAHRGDPGSHDLDAATLQTAAALRDALLGLAHAIEARQGPFQAGDLLAPGFEQAPPQALQQLVRAQLALAAGMVPQLVQLAPIPR